MTCALIACKHMYWDSSALLKLYIREPDSAYFLALASQGTEPIVTSSLAFAEVLCALVRKESEADINRGASDVLFERFRHHIDDGTIELLPLTKETLEALPPMLTRLLRGKPPMLLRSLDAIHIASAQASRSTTVVSTDKRMRAVAALAGLKLLP